MKRITGPMLLSALLAVSVCASDICSGEALPDPAAGRRDAAGAKQVKEMLEARLRNTRIDAVKPSVIPGLYEVRAGGNIFYSDGEYLLFGHIFDTGGRDLTQEAIDDMTAERLKSVTDLGDALKIGNGRHEVIEFTDPECPFCRRAEALLEGGDVTRYIFFYPLPMHRRAKPMSVHILCSENPEAEYAAAMRGGLDGGADLKSCREGEERLGRMVKAARRLGVSGTPLFFIDGKRVSGADPVLKELVR